jgi:SAM-dependent methyltransferase
MNIDKFNYQFKALHRLVMQNHYETLLDIGCGEGEKAWYFAKHIGLRVMAIDEFEGHGSQATFDKSQELFAQEDLSEKVTVKKMNAFSIPDLEKNFDIIYLQNVLHHIFSPSTPFDELLDFLGMLYSCLNPGGILYVSEIGPHNFWDQIFHILPRSIYEKCALFRTVSTVDFGDKIPYGTWKKCMVHTNFEVVQIKFWVPYPFRRGSWLLSNRFFNYFLESNYVIIGRKI